MPNTERRQKNGAKHMSSLSSVSSSTGTSTGTGTSLGGTQAPVQEFGLVSGLNTQAIIQSLLANDQQQVTLLQNQQQTITTEETAVKDIEARLLALQGDTTALSQAQTNVFSSLAVTSSDPSVLTGAASSDATPGTYSVQVNNLAQAAEVASQGFGSASSAIPQGTISFQVGSGPSATITVNGTNDTLQGLAQAINNANIGLTATVVDDGSVSQPYRLLLAANQTGVSSTINVTNNLAADGGGAFSPVFGSTYIGPVNLGSSYTGTSTPTANTGAGAYTGTSNDTYTFTVVNGGTVGTDSNIQLSYTDSSGKNTGTITLSSGDAGVSQNVAQGLQVQFSAGTLVNGQSFSVNAYTPTVQQPTNASVTVGSGSGALTVESPDNQINGLINGVTLQLQGAAAGQPVSLTVASNTSNIQSAIQNFVNDYNSVIQNIAQYTSYDPTTQTAGPLLGNADIEGIQTQLSSIAGSVVQGADSTGISLSTLGLTFDDQGNLIVDNTQLTNALSGQTPGVSLSDIQSLFATTGSSTNSGVQFVSASSSTQPSATPYEVKITQAATQGSAQAENAVSSSVVINGTNDTLAVTVDGQSANITLAQGTYTAQALAQEVQSAINGSFGSTGPQVTVGLAGGALEITSNSYGATSQVQISSNGTALTALGFKGGEAGKGQDVTGNFVVNGVVEAAQGTGQYLIGDATNTHTAGLQVRVSLTPIQVGSGATAQVSVSAGVASQLGTLIQQLADPVSGRLTLDTNSFNTDYQNLQSQITTQNAYIQAKQQSLVNEFSTMETTLSGLQTTGNYLTQLSASLLADEAGAFSSSSSSSNKIA